MHVPWLCCATHLDPEILIIDEVLAVGDHEFQQKCLGKMKDVTSEEDSIVCKSQHGSYTILVR